MDFVTTTSDPLWPSAATLLQSAPHPQRRNVGLLGISTFATSVTSRSAISTPRAIRSALTRYSTWSYSDMFDLADTMCLVDYGDVADPDGDGGSERVLEATKKFDPSLELRVLLGGDNAATWHGLRALAGGELANWGLITIDAHHDLRDGRSNGSPVRQLLEEGLDGHHVVQVGLADFSNSTPASPLSPATSCDTKRSKRRRHTRWWWPAPGGDPCTWTLTWTRPIVPWCRAVRRPHRGV